MEFIIQTGNVSTGAMLHHLAHSFRFSVWPDWYGKERLYSMVLPYWESRDIRFDLPMKTG
jgi:hypothetical protein